MARSTTSASLVNYSEIANRLQQDVRTIKKYVEIFEQSFIIYRLYPFSKKRRDEIVKSPKIYFYDTGLRSALVGDFSNLAIRTDRGALFENFIISEIYKSNDYLDFPFNLNYWRTKQGSEIDLIISSNTDLIGAEVKFSHGSVTKSFKTRYSESKVRMVNSENFY